MRRWLLPGLVAIAAGSLSFCLPSTRPVKSKPVASVSPSLAASALTPSSAVVDLGIVADGGRHVEVFSLTNRGASPINVARIQTSCECVEVRLARSTIEPGETVLGRATLDLSDAGERAGFSRGLAVDVAGLTDSQNEVFTLRLEAQVLPPEALANIGGWGVAPAASSRLESRP